ncbi:MAG: ABC transporter permease [Anaerolineae bacterium]|nr:ABC transporter permease [Anaerolineae bacterium]
MAVAKGAEPIALGRRKTQEKVRTPLTDAWDQFKRNKLAVASAIFVLLMCVLALTADVWKGIGLIDDPLYQHQDPAGKVRMAETPPMTCTQDPRRMDPQWCFVFGADYAGRDNLSRLVYGSRVSLTVGFVGAMVAFIVGIIYGVVSGYYGGGIDNFMMRIVDILYALPELPIIILFQVLFKSLSDYKEKAGPLGQVMLDIDNSMGGLFFVFIVIGLTSWIGVARLARGQVLSYKQKEFVEAARSIGARDRHIIFGHLLPNILGPLIVVVAGAIPAFIFYEATLSYLGVGINPPTPSWGAMINAAQNTMLSKPWMMLWPVVALGSTVMAFNFIGNGLRDAFDPRLRGE